MVLFLSNLEIPVVTTALVDISDELGEFRKASWVTTSYLLGYAGMNVQNREGQLMKLTSTDAI